MASEAALMARRQGAGRIHRSLILIIGAVGSVFSQVYSIDRRSIE
jgi:hypothetical protein